jgi:tripartite-type tricarboxylate transporter receptor subunit TctC
MMNRRGFLVGSALAANPWTVAAFASTPNYPRDKAAIVVGFAPGGAGDLAARVAANYAKSIHRLPVALDYRPGAGGTIATDQVRRAQPDGTILSLFSPSPIIVAPHLQDLPYDPATDFTYVASYAGIWIPAFVRSDSPFKSWDSLIDHARANPGRLRWATAAPRGVAHIATEAAFRQEGVKAAFVPFGGGAEAVTALLGGHIDMVVSSDYGPHLESGAVRLLIETGPASIPAHPELETFKQRGYPIAISAFYGLFGPAGLPQEVIAWWEDVLEKMTESEEYRAFLKAIHGHRLFKDRASFTQTVVESYHAIGRQIDVLGLRP